MMIERTAKPLIKQGWLRAISFFIFYMLVISGVSWLLQKALPTGADTQKSTDPVGAKQGVLLLAFFIITIFTIGVIWLVRRFVDRQTLYSLGFAWKNNISYAATGALAAIAMLGIGTLVLMIAGHLTFTDWNGNLKYLGSNLILMLLVAIMEETIFRGYLLNNLLQSFNKWLALGISAVLFTLVHLGNNGSDVLPMIEILIAGVMLGINYIFTRNLWFGIALHFVWNFMQGPILGYPVSGLGLPSLLIQETNGPAWLTGGVFGFEGSILAMLLNLGLIGLLIQLYNRRQVQETNMTSE